MNNFETICRPRKNKAFTLIELLVVISIIAVLMAVLVPGLRKARDLAKRTFCSANSRSIGIGCYQFAIDNDDWLPMYDGGRFAGTVYESKFPHRDKWYVEIASYLDYGTDEEFFEYKTPLKAVEAGVDAPKALTCPAVPSSYTNGVKAMAFGWNWTTGGYVYKPGFKGDWWKPRKLSKIKNASVGALLGENRWDEPMEQYKAHWAWGNSAGSSGSAVPPENYYYPIRHDGGGFYICVDGHVEFAKYEVVFKDFFSKGPINYIRPHRYSR